MRGDLLIVAAAVAAVLPTTVFAENQGPDISFAASVSYVYDFNDPDPGAVVPDSEPNISPGNNALSYANQEGADEAFNIDLVQLGIMGSRGNASYGAKLDFGDLTPLAGDSLDGDVALQEAYLTYNFGGAAVTAGRFGTPIGYEVLEPWNNANISRSRAWVQGQPVNHDGLNVSGVFGNFDFMAGLVNSSVVNDPVANETNDNKGVVASAGVTFGDAAVSLAGLYSEDTFNDFGFPGNDFDVDSSIVNFIASAPAGPLHFAIEGNWFRDSIEKAVNNDKIDFWNVALYAGADIGMTAIDTRFDYGQVDLTDPDDPFNATVNLETFDVWSATVTFSWTLVEGMDLRAEYRYDDFNTDFFVEDDGVEDSAHVVQAQLVLMPQL